MEGPRTSLKGEASHNNMHSKLIVPGEISAPSDIRCVCSSFSHVQLFATLWTVARQASLSMGFSRQEYWIGLPFTSPGDCPDPGIEPRSLALQAESLPSEPPRKSRYADDTSLMAESKEKLKSLLKKVKEEHEKAGLKLNIQKTKIMASSPITCQIDGEKSRNSDRFYFVGLQNHCGWGLQPCT